MREVRWATGLAALGVLFALASVVIFSLGWEYEGVPRLAVCGGSLLLSAIALFVFAEGWDRIKSLQNSADISGRVQWPSLPPDLIRDTRVELITQSGQISGSAKPDSEGSFALHNIPDGVWRLQIAGSWISSVEREIRLQRRERLDLGDFQLRFAGDRVWRTERLPLVSQLSGYARDATGAEWAVGFHSKDGKNSRIILRRAQEGAWTERIVPQMAKAERIEFVKILRDSTIVIGSLDAGAVFSRDQGVTWKAIALPPNTNSMSSMLEFPDGSLVAATWKFRGGNSPSGVVARYAELEAEPSVSLIMEERRGGPFFFTSTGRVLMGTSGREPDIRYSEDYGATWTVAAEKGDGAPIYGKFCEFIEQDGVLLTAIRPLNNGNRIYRSNSDGLNWSFEPIDAEVRSLHGFATSDHGIVCLASGQLQKRPVLFFSSDRGRRWSPLMEIQSGYAPHGQIGKLQIVAGEAVLVSLNTLSWADATKLHPGTFADVEIQEG